MDFLGGTPVGIFREKFFGDLLDNIQEESEKSIFGEIPAILGGNRGMVLARTVRIMLGRPLGLKNPREMNSYRNS